MTKIRSQLETSFSISESFRELPEGWTVAPLRDLADIQGGLTKGKKRPPGTTLRDVPYLRVANVQRGYLDLTEVKTIEATEDEVASLRLEPGDVLFNEGGDRDKLGRGWIWNSEIPECIHQNHVFRARIYGKVLHPKLLSWYGNSEGAEYFMREGKQTTNLASINRTNLSALPVCIPPKPEQQRIVEAIESYFTRLDDAVATLERVERNLKRYRASVLKAAVEGRLVATEAELARQEGRDYEPAAVLLERILEERRRRWEQAELARLQQSGKPPRNDAWKARYKEPAAPDTSNLPELPEGWCWATLDQCSYLVRNGQSRAPRAKNGVPILRISAVRPLSIDFSDVRYLPGTPADYASDLLEVGDLLFTRYNGNPSLVGVCGLVRQIQATTAHPDKLIKVRVPNELVSPNYLELASNTGASRKHISERTRTTAGQAGVSGGDLKQMPMPLPPLAEQVRIANEVERLFSLSDSSINIVATNHARAQRLRQSILKWAFEGKLADQDPDDEPASVLLERIRAERQAAQTHRKPGRQTRGPKKVTRP